MLPPLKRQVSARPWAPNLARPHARGEYDMLSLRCQPLIRAHTDSTPHHG